MKSLSFSTQVFLLRNSMEYVHGLRRALMTALALIYFLSFGFPVVWVTTLFAISTIIMTFFEFPTGAIADYDSRKKSMMICFFLMSLSFFGLFAFDSFWLLGLSWVLGDIAFTFCTGATNAWAVDALDATKNKSILIKLGYQATIYERLGQITGGIIGFLVVSFSLHNVWLVVSLSNLLMFIVIWKYMEERNFVPEKAQHHYVKKVMIKAKESFLYIMHQQNKKLRVLLSVGVLTTISISAFFIALPIFLTEMLHLEARYLNVLYGAVTIITLLVPAVAKNAAARMSFHISLMVLWILMGVSMLISGISQHLILAIIGLTFIQCIDTMLGIVEGSALEMEASSKIRASLGSIASIVWALSNSVAVFLAGITIQFFGSVTVMILCGILAIVNGVLYFVGLRDSIKNQY